MGGGPTLTYTDPRDASARVDLWVDDVAPPKTANDAVRSLFNFGFFTARFAQDGILAADVRLDAPVPYFLTGNAQVGYTLLFGVKGGDWVVTAHAPTRADLEALVRGLISGLS